MSDSTTREGKLAGATEKDLRMMEIAPEAKGEGVKLVKFVIKDGGEEAGQFRFTVLDEEKGNRGKLDSTPLEDDAAKIGIDLEGDEISAPTLEGAQRLAEILNNPETQKRIHELAEQMRLLEQESNQLGDEDETPDELKKRMEELLAEGAEILK